MNKKGFSLIELLAVIIIIGIVGTIGVAAVSGYIQDSRKSAFSDMAKLYVEKASEERAKDILPHDIKDGEAILLPLEKYKLEKNEDFGTPYGNMKLDYCYVIITNNNNNYNYYIFMLDDTDHAIVGVEYADIGNESVIDGSDSANISKILNYKTLNGTSKLTVGGNIYKLKTQKGTYAVLIKE